jgi:hypothetical protein
MVDLSTYYTKTQTDALFDEKTDLSVVAPEFSASISYAVGDYVTYDGKLYECTTAHEAGAWNSSDFTEKTVAELAAQTGLYLEKSNPVGTGSLSMNRKSGTTTGRYSVTEGYNGTASGDYSHAEGVYTNASGEASHAEGEYTNASGDYSHAEGAYTNASGNGAHAEGFNTIAKSTRQHVQGRFNVADNHGTYADIIGNGADADNRKNIEATTWTGDKRLKGTVYINCNDDSTGGTDVVLAAYPVGSLYWTSKASFDPNIAWGGTWVRIKDKFIYAMGDNDTVNATGGAKTVTLGTTDLPDHHHIFSGTTTYGYLYSIAVDNDGVTPSKGFISYSNARTYKDEGGSESFRYYDFTMAVTPTGKATGIRNTSDATFTQTAVDKMPPYICKYCWERVS